VSLNIESYNKLCTGKYFSDNTIRPEKLIVYGRCVLLWLQQIGPYIGCGDLLVLNGSFDPQ